LKLLAYIRVAAVGQLLVAALQAGESTPVNGTNEPPVLLMITPLGVVAGEKATVTLRGLNLTNATEVTFSTSKESLPGTIMKRETAPKLDGFEAKRVGDQQLGIEFSVPSDAAVGTNAWITVKTATAVSMGFPVAVIPAGRLVLEKEPNNGFREAQRIASGDWIRGTIDPASDVDVFQISGEPGASFHAEILAGQIGSTLDSVLSVYDSKGTLLASNDDTVGPDPRVSCTYPAAGSLWLSVTSVNEKASKSYEYILKVWLAH
jgi:hypothetical protein